MEETKKRNGMVVIWIQTCLKVDDMGSLQEESAEEYGLGYTLESYSSPKTRIREVSLSLRIYRFSGQACITNRSGT